MDTRITGKKVDIDGKKNLDFWEKQALEYDEKNPYVSVFFRKNDEMCEQNAKELDILTRSVGIGSTSCVLDIGCGIGRTCESLPSYKHFVGLDQATGMIKIAQERLKDKNNTFFSAVNCSIGLKQYFESENQPILYDKLILNGITQYLNDDEVMALVKNTSEILAIESSIFVSITEAKEARLTLKDFYAENLQSEYSAIYRTYDEYLHLFHHWFAEGFVIAERGCIADDASTPETIRNYIVLKRNPQV